MFKLALRNLLSQKVRSALSILGTMVAIAGMVGLFSVSEGLSNEVGSTFSRIPGLLATQPGAPMPLFSKLPRDWGDEIAQVAGVNVVNPEVWQRVNIINDEVIISPPRFLYGTDLVTRSKLKTDLYRNDLQEGRYLSEKDIGTSNIVLSRSIAEEFEVGVGKSMEINGYDFTVVGIYQTSSMLLDVAIIVSLESMREMGGADEKFVSSFYIEPDDDADPDEVSERITDLFRGREGSDYKSRTTFGALANPFGSQSADETDSNKKSSDSPKKSDKQDEERSAIEVRSSQQLAGRIMEFSKRMDLFLVIITSIGVIIAVLSIVNTMIMSVSERVIEFGILKANGWSRWNVLSLVTWESLLLGTVGGVLGCGAGWLMTIILTATWPDRLVLLASPTLLIGSLLFSALMGVIGGLYPAIWAMRMMPMDAIRRG